MNGGGGGGALNHLLSYSIKVCIIYSFEACDLEISNM